MEKLHLYKILFSIFVLLLLLSLHLLPSSAYSPPTEYFINCGSKSSTNFAERNFVGDENSGSFSFSRGSSRDSDHSPTNNISLYETARVSKRSSSYKFQIAKNGIYLVRLHFYAFLSPNSLPAARFNVSISGFALLSNFNVQNGNSSVIKEFFISVNEEELRICFTPSRGTTLAFVNALEVLLMPEHFIPQAASYFTSTGENNRNYSSFVSKVVQTIYRINVRGEMISYDYDTGEKMGTR